jgi:hypothetical protein
VDYYLLIQIVLAVATVVAAVYAAVQANAAKNSAKDAKTDASAALYQKLKAKYDEVAFSDTLARLRRFGEKEDGKEFPDRVNDWAKDAESSRPSELAKLLDQDRRSVGELFHDAAVFVEKGALGPEWVDVMNRWSGKAILHRVVLPMNRAKKEKLGTSSEHAMDFERRILKVFP